MLTKLASSIGFFIFLFACTVVSMLGVMLHCGYNIYLGNALETFDIIIMDHPVLTSLGVSYLEVLIGDVCILLALIIVWGLRYHYYKDERDFIKKYNIKGKTRSGSDSKPAKSGVGK